MVVLSGDHGDRLRLALGLVERGLTSTLVLAGELDSEQARQLCARRNTAFEIVCLSPRPDSTRAEARAVAMLMADRAWDNVVVATTTHHVTRSRLLFRRCTERRVQFVGSKPPYGASTAARVIAHEIGGFLYAIAATRGC